MPNVQSEKIALRQATPEDLPLLALIYAHTRQEELDRATEWSIEQKHAFVLHQFHAQDAYYKEVYPNAEYSVILYEGTPAGRLYVERNLIPGTIRVIDISLLPDFRNLGIGAYLLERLQDEARDSDKTLSIHVEKFNRAQTLYQRLGFQPIKETHGVYILMEWKAA